MKQSDKEIFNRGVIQGYAMATANIMRSYNEPIVTQEVLKVIDWRNLKKYGVDESDLKELEPIIKELKRKSK